MTKFRVLENGGCEDMARVSFIPFKLPQLPNILVCLGTPDLLGHFSQWDAVVQMAR